VPHQPRPPTSRTSCFIIRPTTSAGCSRASTIVASWSRDSHIDRIGHEARSSWTDPRRARASTPGATPSHGSHPLRTAYIPPIARSPFLPAARHAGQSRGSCATSATTPRVRQDHLGEPHRGRCRRRHGFHEFWGYLYHLTLCMRELSRHQQTPTEQPRAAVQETPIRGLPSSPAPWIPANQRPFLTPAATSDVVQIVRLDGGDQRATTRSADECEAVENSD